MGHYAARTGPSTFDRTCMICPRGTYSDTDTATDCTQCPSGQTTLQEGSNSSSNCEGGNELYYKVTLRSKSVFIN